jgi:transposase-like protein
MAVIPDFRNETLLAFLKDNVAPGSTVYTDGLKSFTGQKEAGFRHVPRAPSRCELTCERAQSPWCRWRIGP